VQPDMKIRVAEYWSKVAPELGERVAEGLGVGAVASR
jgi:catalase